MILFFFYSKIKRWGS